MRKLMLLGAVASVSAIRFLKEPQGDPECAHGLRSFSTDKTAVTVCCPAYCGECSDYDTCRSVNGQNSENACCASKVQSLVCENNSADPHCLKKCTEKSAPCSLGVVEDVPAPKAEPTAAADCTKAESKYVDACKNAMTGTGETGQKQWDDLQRRE